jgi:hypothetical protein
MNKALEETWRAGRHEWWCTIHFGRRPALLGREERHGRGGAQAIFAVHDGTELSGKMQEWHGDSTVVRNRYRKPHFENCKRHFLNILSVLKDGFVTRSNSWKCVLWIVPPSRYVRGFTDCLEQPQESKLYQLSRRHQNKSAEIERTKVRPQQNGQHVKVMQPHTPPFSLSVRFRLCIAACYTSSLVTFRPSPLSTTLGIPMPSLFVLFLELTMQTNATESFFPSVESYSRHVCEVKCCHSRGRHANSSLL